MPNAILLISCPDNKGITATVTQFVYQNFGNILHADQHTDDQFNTFFMRVEWSMDGFALNEEKVAGAFKPIADKFKMDWKIYFSDKVPKVAVFVSKYLHCLYDLLYRYRAGYLKCEIPLIISNHSDAANVAENFGIKFHEMPMTKENKAAQEARQLKLLREADVELIVLARYHQILTPQFIATYPEQIINIHHSFLPAFAGKDPYAQAYQKGVKLIGATSHFVTEVLDEGPIIAQDTVGVSHRDTLADLKRRGEDLEKIVLSDAVRFYLERKILVYNNKTVVFD